MNGKKAKQNKLLVDQSSRQENCQVRIITAESPVLQIIYDKFVERYFNTI